MADTVNIEVDQGADYVHTFQYFDVVTEQPIDLTGYTVEAQVRPFPNSSTVLFDGDNGGKGNVELLDAVNGKVKITIPGATSAGWSNDEMAYDVKGTVGGVAERIVQGTVFLNKATTRA